MNFLLYVLEYHQCNKTLVCIPCDDVKLSKLNSGVLIQAQTPSSQSHKAYLELTCGGWRQQYGVLGIQCPC